MTYDPTLFEKENLTIDGYRGIVRKQFAEIEELRAENARLKARIEELESALGKMVHWASIFCDGNPKDTVRQKFQREAEIVLDILEGGE